MLNRDLCSEQEGGRQGSFGFELPAIDLGNGAYANPAYVDLADLEASIDGIASQYVSPPSSHRSDQRPGVRAGQLAFLRTVLLIKGFKGFSAPQAWSPAPEAHAGTCPQTVQRQSTHVDWCISSPHTCHARAHLSVPPVPAPLSPPTGLRRASTNL